MKRIEGTYQNDQPVSLWRAWDEDGSLKTEKNYAALNPPINSSDGEPSVEGTDIEIFPNSLPSPSLPSPKIDELKNQPNQIELLPPPEEEKEEVITDIEENQLDDTLELASPQTNKPSSNAEAIK
ncbi:hypothetical protein OAK85_00480 [Mariniblastus sp.]|nr:hypothetical protein [Mariniblastus sp.]